MKAKTPRGTSVGEIQPALNEVLADGFKPSLAVVFISIKHHRNELCSLLQQQVKNRQTRVSQQYLLCGGIEGKINEK